MQIIYGLISGIISGFGMGGGTILILCLTIFENMPQNIAQATNLVFFLPASISAILANRNQIPVDKKLIKTIVFWGIIGALIGAKISIGLNVHTLRKFFGFFLLLICINEIYSIYKMYKNKKMKHNKKAKNEKENKEEKV